MKRIYMLIPLFLFVIITASCNMLSTYSKSYFYFDTIINISIKADNKKHLKNIENIYKNLSNYSNNYESYNGLSIKDLNDNREIELNDDIKGLLDAAIDLKEKTNGYFNPFIGRLANLWKDVVEEKVNDPLGDNVINDELNIMNSTSLIYEDNKAKLIGDANFDLGGIAKGYATEEVHKYLVENNIKEYIIDAGHSNILLGYSKKGVNVSINHPFKENTYYGKMSLSDIAIATSSPEHQRREIDGILYHHILSPFTGKPSNIYSSINVICDNSMYADAYSTALFSMELDDLKDFVDKNNIEIIVAKDDDIIYKKVDGEIEKI